MELNGQKTIGGRRVNEDLDSASDAKDMKCVDIFGDEEGGTDEEDTTNDEDYCIEKDLLAEEAKIRKFNAAKMEKDEKAEKAAAMAAAVEMTEDERYSKVMDLLKKSEFYSQFLLEKIENGDDSNSLKQKKINERKMLHEKEPKTAEKEMKDLIK